jgi:hypothetical protein
VRALSVLTIASLVGLVAYAQLGSFVRYVADDWCSAATVRALGWAGAQSQLYTVVNGRLAATGLATALELPGPWVANWIGPGSIALLCASIFLALTTLHVSRSVAASGAVLATFAIVAAAPQPFQSFYWLSGATTYAAPLILMPLTFIAAKRGWLAAVAGLSLLIATFSETAAAVLLAAALLFVFLAPSHRPALLTIVVGTLAGALLVAASPSAGIRMAALPRPDLWVALATTIFASVVVFVQLLDHAPGVVVLVIAVSFVLAASGNGDPLARRRLHRMTLAAALLIGASLFPAAWATSALPAERAMLYAAIVILGWLGLFGWAMGSDFGRRHPIWRPVAARAIFALTVIPLAMVANLALHQPEFASSAANLERLERAAAGGGTVVWSPTSAPRPLASDLTYPGVDPSGWENNCLAGFLGVSEVSVVP